MPKRPNTQSSPIKTDDEKLARSAKDKADLFAEHLEETFQTLGRQYSYENIADMPRISD